MKDGVLQGTENLLSPEEAEQREFSTESILARATTVTLVLEEIIAQRGVPHGGLND